MTARVIVTGHWRRHVRTTYEQEPGDNNKAQKYIMFEITTTFKYKYPGTRYKLGNVSNRNGENQNIKRSFSGLQ